MDLVLDRMRAWAQSDRARRGMVNPPDGGFGVSPGAGEMGGGPTTPTPSSSLPSTRESRVADAARRGITPQYNLTPAPNNDLSDAYSGGVAGALQAVPIAAQIATANEINAPVDTADAPDMGGRAARMAAPLVRGVAGVVGASLLAGPVGGAAAAGAESMLSSGQAETMRRESEAPDTSPRRPDESRKQYRIRAGKGGYSGETAAGDIARGIGIKARDESDTTAQRAMRFARAPVAAIATGISTAISDKVTAAGMGALGRIAANMAFDVPDAVAETALQAAGDGQPVTMDSLVASGGVATVANLITGSMHTGSISGLQRDLHAQARSDVRAEHEVAGIKAAGEMELAQAQQQPPMEGGGKLGGLTTEPKAQPTSDKSNTAGGQTDTGSAPRTSRGRLALDTMHALSEDKEVGADRAGMMVGRDESFTNADLIEARKLWEEDTQAARAKYRETKSNEDMQAYSKLASNPQSTRNALAARGPEALKAAGVEMSTNEADVYYREHKITPEDVADFQRRMQEREGGTQPTVNKPQPVDTGDTPEAAGKRLYDQLSSVHHAGLPPLPPNVKHHLGNAAREAVGAAGEAANYLHKQVLSDMETYVRAGRQQGGGSAPDEAAAKVRRASDSSKIYLGQMNAELHAAQLAAGKHGDDSLHAWDLAPSGGHSQSRLLTLLERNRKPKGAPAHYINPASQIPITRKAANVLAAGAKFIAKRGEIAENIGVQRINPATGKPEFFTNSTDIAPRQRTSIHQDIIAHGPSGEAWIPMINAYAEENPGIPREVFERHFLAEHEASSSGASMDAQGRAIATEFFRDWESVPHILHIKGKYGRRDLPLYEYRPYEYFTALAQHAAGRFGVIESFGQDIGTHNSHRDMLDAYHAETGNAKPLKDALAALQGQPLDRPLIDPGSSTANIMRATQSVIGIAKALNLSASAVNNAAELVFGNAQVFSNLGDWGKAMKEYATNHKAFEGAYRALGAATGDVANTIIDPHKPITSTLSIGGEKIMRIVFNKFLNEVQEHLAPGIRAQAVARMKAGKGGGTDAVDLKVAGFPRKVARLMAAGKGIAEDYDAYIRLGGTQETGSPATGADLSRIEHNRAFQAALAFTRYPMMQIRKFTKLMQVVGEDSHESFTSGKWNEALPAYSRLAKFLGFKTAQGVAGYMLTAFATGGAQGTTIAFNEFTDHPVSFLRDALVYNVLAGPFGAVLHYTAGDTGNLVNNIYPIFAGREIHDALFGEGSYTNLGKMERGVKLVERMTPINRTVANVAALVGYHQGINRNDINIRAYWRWQRRNRDLGEVDIKELDPAGRQFQQGMRAAYQLIKNGESPAEVQKAIVRAALPFGREKGLPEAELRKKAMTSLRNRKLLTRGKLGAADEKEFVKKVQSLRSGVGDRAFKELLAHDALLSAMIEGVKTL